MVTIIDHGFANVGSVVNMCRKIRVACELSADPEVVAKANFLLLPGVGSFDAGMARLNETGLKDAIDEAVKVRGIPLVGICLGMQFLLEGSEEGVLPGLGYIKGRNVKFPANMTEETGKPIKVPHMGWNEVEPTASSKSFKSFEPDEEIRFYFVHSYYAKLDHQADEAARSDYGIPFTCAVEHENVFGFQFHPEKSHRYGMKLLSDVLPHE